MNSRFVIRIAAFVAVAALPATAFAQAVPGAEIVGQPVQVTTNGVTNTVIIEPWRPGGDRNARRSCRQRYVERSQRAALPQQRRRPGMLALQLALPGRPADDADQLMQCDLDLACAGYQPAAADTGPAGRARPLGRF